MTPAGIFGSTLFRPIEPPVSRQVSQFASSKTAGAAATAASQFAAQLAGLLTNIGGGFRSGTQVGSGSVAVPPATSMPTLRTPAPLTADPPNPPPTQNSPSVPSWLATPSWLNTEAPDVTPPAAPKLESSADAYWSEQPAAVQALRKMDDPNARWALAQQLENQGYNIDVPIMVWGWDPLTTMQMRQADGYTWVPSLGQAPVTLPVGVTVSGVNYYDPNNPAPRSIPVTTAFAKGTSDDPALKNSPQT